MIKTLAIDFVIIFSLIFVLFLCVPWDLMKEICQAFKFTRCYLLQELTTARKMIKENHRK